MAFASRNRAFFPVLLMACATLPATSSAAPPGTRDTIRSLTFTRSSTFSICDAPQRCTASNVRGLRPLLQVPMRTPCEERTRAHCSPISPRLRILTVFSTTPYPPRMLCFDPKRELSHLSLQNIIFKPVNTALERRRDDHRRGFLLENRRPLDQISRSNSLPIVHRHIEGLPFKDAVPPALQGPLRVLLPLGDLFKLEGSLAGRGLQPESEKLHGSKTHGKGVQLMVALVEIRHGLLQMLRGQCSRGHLHFHFVELPCVPHVRRAGQGHVGLGNMHRPHGPQGLGFHLFIETVDQV